MKAIFLSVAIGLILAACVSNDIDPIAYLKAREEAPAAEANYTLESIGFWQKMCGANKNGRWSEAAQYCSGRKTTGRLCTQVIEMEGVRKKGRANCSLG